MTNTPFDELGPVDYVVVEFRPARRTSPARWRPSLKLVDAGTIRVIDVPILDKNEDGSVEATELADVDQLGELQTIEAELADLLAADDVDHLAAPWSPAALPACSSSRTCGPRHSHQRRDARGQLVANGRIPIQAIIASIEADPVGATTEGG